MSGKPKRVRQALKNRWTNQTGLMQADTPPDITYPVFIRKPPLPLQEGKVDDSYKWDEDEEE